MIKRYDVVDDFNFNTCLVFLKLRNSSFPLFKKIKKFSKVLRSTRAVKYVQLQEKSINLLYSGYLCAPRGWNDRYRSYSTSSDTVSGIRRIDPARRYCDVPYMRPAWHIGSQCQSFPLAYTCVDVKTRVPSCGTIETWITWSAFQPQYCEPECLPTYLNWTARACDTVVASESSVVSSIFSAPCRFPVLFFPLRIFPFHLRSAVPRTSPAMQIVFCRKTCRFAAEEANAMERM